MRCDLVKIGLVLLATVAIFASLSLGEIPKENAASSGTITAAAFAPIVVESDFKPAEDRVVILYSWDFSQPVQAREVVVDGKRRLYVWSPPGEYEIREEIVTAAKGAGDTFKLPTRKIVNVFTVRVEGKPIPPDPPDPPDPMIGRVESILILRDPLTDTAEETRALLEIRTLEQFARPPPELLILDKDQRTAAGELDPRAAKHAPQSGGEYPHYFLLDSAGRVIEHQPLGTVEAFVGAVKQFSR